MSKDKAPAKSEAEQKATKSGKRSEYIADEKTSGNAISNKLGPWPDPPPPRKGKK